MIHMRECDTAKFTTRPSLFSCAFDANATDRPNALDLEECLLCRYQTMRTNSQQRKGRLLAGVVEGVWGAKF